VSTLAELLGHSGAVELLQQTLNEEKAADEKLTQKRSARDSAKRNQLGVRSKAPVFDREKSCAPFPVPLSGLQDFGTSQL
jgi:hypothetical protein